MSTKLTYPEFASESEEADWFYEHREELDLYFSPSDKTLQEILAEHDLDLPSVVVAVSLSADDAEKLTAVAKSHGLAPEDFAGRVVHDALHAKQAA